MSALAPSEYLWLVEALLSILAVGLLAAFAVGALLLASPQAAFAINARLSRWVDTHDRFRALEQPRLVERFFYRHHRMLGTAIALGALYVLWRWAFDYRRADVLAMLDRPWSTDLAWVVAALETSIVALHAAIFALGLVILVRPSLLKSLERAANRWHHAPGLEQLDRTITAVDSGFAVYPRLSGLVVVLAAAWSLSALAPALFEVLQR